MNKGWPKGVKRGPQTEEHHQKSANAARGHVYGSYKGTERAKKIGLSNKGKPKPPVTAEHRAALSRARLGKKHTPEHRENNRKAQTGLPRNHPADFAQRCKAASQRRWAGYVHKEPDSRNDQRYFKWRGLVFKRDKRTCRRCGITLAQLRQLVPGIITPENSMQAHHIKPWAEYPELRFDVDNGITFCPTCHKLIHKNQKAGPQPRPFTRLRLTA